MYWSRALLFHQFSICVKQASGRRREPPALELVFQINSPGLRAFRGLSDAAPGPAGGPRLALEHAAGFFPKDFQKTSKRLQCGCIKVKRVAPVRILFFYRMATPHARPPSSRLEWKRLKHSSRDALHKSVALRAGQRECRDVTKSSQKMRSRILGSQPACEIKPPVGADCIRTVVNAAEDKQRKKL